MRTLRLALIVALTATAHSAVESPEWRVGVARADITPRGPIWMGGYAARDHPSEGVLQPLWAKALLFEDRAGGRAAIVTLDLIGIERALADAVCERIRERTGIARERVLLNCSHTHSGPVVASVTPIVYDMDDRQQAAVEQYARELADRIVLAVEAAAKDLRPARLAFGEGRAAFGANRRAMRVKTPDGAPKPPAPVDHGVPVLVIRDAQTGAARALLFGYACHATTLGAYEINGDYPGFAQAILEARHPGVTALFMAGCGADVNPHPRREVALAREHGGELAAAVDAVIDGHLRSVRGPLGIGFERVDLELVSPPDREALERLARDPNKYKQRLAKHSLGELAAGRPLPARYPCPVQVAQFGRDLTLIALAGEVCVDYALRFRREFGSRPVWIAGFCNEIFAYVPSERVLAEGGYEGGDAMVYFALHGPFRPGLEQRIADAVRRLAEATR